MNDRADHATHTDQGTIRMNTDVLDRLRAADISAPTDATPPFHDVLGRIAAQREEATTSTPATRPLRVAGTAGVVVAGALTTFLVATTGGPDDGGVPRLGVLQAAAASARADPGAGRFSGYVREQRLTVATPGGAATTVRSREIVRRVSATEFDGTLETTQEAPPRDLPPVPQVPGVDLLDTGGARVSETRDGSTITRRSTWRRPYGTVFHGALRGDERPARVPTRPQDARAAVLAWAAGRPPAGSAPSETALLRDAYGTEDGTQLALGYASGVLTAPRVAPAVRAAVFAALADVPGVLVQPRAIDPDGRPAAALTSRSTRGGNVSRFELLVDPETSRVLGTREHYTPSSADGSADEANDAGGTGESVYHYVD